MFNSDIRKRNGNRRTQQMNNTDKIQIQSRDRNDASATSETSDCSGFELEDAEVSQMPRLFGSNGSTLSHATSLQLDLVIRYLNICIACNGSAVSRSLPKQKDLFQWVEDKIEVEIVNICSILIEEMFLFFFFKLVKKARNLLIDWSVLKARNSNHINTKFCSLNHVREYLKKCRKSFVDQTTSKLNVSNGNNSSRCKAKFNKRNNRRNMEAPLENHNNSNNNNSSNNSSNNNSNSNIPKEIRKESGDVDDETILPPTTPMGQMLFDSENPTHNIGSSTEIITNDTMTPHDLPTPNSSSERQLEMDQPDTTDSGDTVNSPLETYEKETVATASSQQYEGNVVELKDDVSDTENWSEEKRLLAKDDGDEKEKDNEANRREKEKENSLNGNGDNNNLQELTWAPTPLVMCTSIPSTLAPTISADSDFTIDNLKILSDCYDIDPKDSNETQLNNKILVPVKAANSFSGCEEKHRLSYEIKIHQNAEDINFLECSSNKSNTSENTKEISEFMIQCPSEKMALLSSLPLGVNYVNN
ncbi:WD40 repeat-containing protein [Reticulomyxa filosa]|uniref:WD40 repeat-containing protein n=1 Tax=Reticulomyxa filosa TaxID=46433 RepID=X6NB27_RETFI|nr:WD40 repeat-containing protein [Reticulomyxa filosa]|eukprot:ETO23485.1 WD40 repeat-containing protein [Reticulomyxa filosa]